MQFVIFQGISQPLSRKGLRETCAAEDFLGMMALRTVLTCLSVVPGDVHQKSADYFYPELASYFPSLILSLWTAGPPVTLQKHLLTSAIVCSAGG